MQLRRACELLSEAHTKGNAVDFWRAIGLVEQALAQLKETEASYTYEGRFLIDHEYADEWRLWDRERLVVGMSAAELHQLTAAAMGADGRRQGL